MKVIRKFKGLNAVLLDDASRVVPLLESRTLTQQGAITMAKKTAKKAAKKSTKKASKKK